MKQRLVGALVLLSGGVVLWSVLFTGPAAYKVDRDTQIPPRPEVETVPEMSPEPPPGVASLDTEVVPPREKEKQKDADRAEEAETADAGAAEKAPEPVKEEPEEAETTQPASRPALRPETNLPVAWVVQVASFSKQDNADALKEKLQGKGYKAYVQHFRGAKGELYRVMVGPKVSQRDAQREQREIEKTFGLNTLLVQYDQ